ncbi:hypothetical protein EDD85DRAFT_789728 [Armillaria nabsnona]|nr:hypothetical protein EDD85DRAFT_789728 [Armillaria nabsnona]
MQAALDGMKMKILWVQGSMSSYNKLTTLALNPIVKAIAVATGLKGYLNVNHEAVIETRYNFNISVYKNWVQDGHIRQESILICSNENKVYFVLLAKAEALSRPFSLDANKKQTGTKAMAVKMQEQNMVFFFGGLIVIATQLTFKLQDKVLPNPWQSYKTLMLFQANIQPKPFLAILLAMVCSNIIPGHSVKSPPATLTWPLQLESIPAADEAVEDDKNVSDEAQKSGIPVSRWSSIYTCHVKGNNKLHIMKLVAELHSVMILCKLYMYEMALRDCSLVSRFYGMFQRPVGGWFGFLLENVGDSLE